MRPRVRPRDGWHQIGLTFTARSRPFDPISSTNATTMSTAGVLLGAIAEMLLV